MLKEKKIFLLVKVVREVFSDTPTLEQNAYELVLAIVAESREQAEKILKKIGGVVYSTEGNVEFAYQNICCESDWRKHTDMANRTIIFKRWIEDYSAEIQVAFSMDNTSKTVGDYRLIQVPQLK